jgi:hypothetical protein
MEECFKGSGKGMIGGRGIYNKCKNNEKWDTKMNKCVKMSKNEIKNNYSIKFIAFSILIICSIYLKYWLSLILLVFVFILIIVFNYDSIKNSFS